MRTIIEYKDLTWVDILEPTEEDIRYLKKRFRLHSLTLKTIIPSIHHPDLDVFKNYISMILHYPRTEEGQYVGIYEFDIIAGKDYIITNHYNLIKPINLILEECTASEAKKEEYMGNGVETFLFLVLSKFLKRIMEKVDEIGEQVGGVEKNIFTENEQEMVKQISFLKRKIISFWRAFGPQSEVFYNLKSVGTNFFGVESKHYFSNLFRINKRIDTSLKAYKETIESLEETNHSMVNLKMNDVIQVLTIFSVFFLPLTLLASIWGMNTNFLPFENNVFDFWLIVGLMVFTLFVMLLYFKKKKWL